MKALLAAPVSAAEDSRPSRRVRAAAGVVALAVAAVLALGSFGCSSGAGTVAATVNGEELPVSVLTDYIDGVRATIGSQTDAAWEAYLADAGYTVDEYWDYLIDHYGREMAVTQRCEELGIEATEEEVDERVAELKELLGCDTDQTAFMWDAYLENGGYTEETLRASLAYNVQLDKLYEQEVPRDDDMTDEEWAEACRAYAQDLYDAADVEVLVEHQYDVPGQSHGGPEPAADSPAEAGEAGTPEEG